MKQELQQIVQIIELVESPEAIAAYRKAHDEIWPEITAGIRSVGITRMDLYLYGYTAVMIVELPADVDFDEAMWRLAALPRQSEWEAHVAPYQKCDPAATSAGKWHRMEQIFAL